MTQGVPELRSAWSFPLIERDKEYYLTAKLYRSRLVIEVYWYGEELSLD